MSIEIDQQSRDRLGGPDGLVFPSNWTLSTSWRRAQSADASKNPLTDQEWMVQIDDGDRHRVTFAVENSEIVADCDCDGWTYRDWCAHVAHLWWCWVRGQAVVTDIDTGRNLTMPPAWLTVETEARK